MLIARYAAINDFTLVQLLSTFGEFRRAFPALSWVDPVTNGHLAAQNVPARLVVEVPQPALEFGQTATFTAERQPDGTWLQVWEVVTVPLEELKASARSAVNALESEKISTRELARGLAASPAAPRPRTASVMAKADEIRARIEAAVDGPELKAILDEIEAF